MIDSRILAEHLTRTQFAKTHDFAGVRVDRDVGFPAVMKNTSSEGSR